jgi:hypothetical protein
MDWPTFAVEMVKALAWPITTLVGLLVLRRPIVSLIPLLQRLKYKDLELDFARRVSEVRAEAAAELPTAQVPALPPAELETMRELARVSPRAAVIEGWRQVELAAVEAARRNDVSLDAHEALNPNRVLLRLQKAGVVDSGKIGLYHDLRALRNQAAHAPEFALPAEAALQYAEIARELADYLRTAGRHNA